jgi:F420H(2)-dependent quinone reductase
MAESSARLRRQARLMNAINVPMRMILQLPFPTPLSRQLMLVYLKGRKTGRNYRQPVSFVHDGETLLTPGGGRWKLNLRDQECVRVRLGGRDRQGRPELVSDVDQVETLLRKMIAANPRITSFAPVVGPHGQIDRGRVEEAVRYGFVIVRWQFDCPPAGSA